MSETIVVTTPTPAETLEILTAPVTVDVQLQPATTLEVEQVRTTVEIEQTEPTTVEILSAAVGPPGEDGTPGNPPIAAEADVDIEPGQPVYVKPNTHVDLASAATQAPARLAGLAVTSAIATVSVDFITDGHLELDDWTDVIGTAELTPGATYFLSSTAGRLTTTPPSTGFIVVAGKALTTQTFHINITEPIGL